MEFIGTLQDSGFWLVKEQKGLAFLGHRLEVMCRVCGSELGASNDWRTGTRATTCS